MINKVTKISGFTLIELIASLVVLSIGITAFIMLVIQTTHHSADPMIQEQANAIAQSYLEEVLLNPFCDPDLSTDCPTTCVASACSSCTAAEASRDLYDDVCDYNGLVNNGARDQNNNAIAGLGAFNITVNVRDTGITLGGLDSNSGQVVRIDVNVKHNNFPALNLNLSGYKANY